VGTIWVRELIGGLDTRKLAETTPGGVLIRAVNGHITRGGEFEKRAAFVSAYTLPTGTVGLAYTPTSLVVFGSGPSPTMPAGVLYQRLQHPDLTTALVRVASFDLYAGKIYVAGEFADGSIHHFYDGTRVGNWYDGRARATFTLVSGALAVAAQGSFRITAAAAGTIDTVTVGGSSIIDSPIPATGTVDGTATAVAVEINTSAAGYSASAVGDTVTITAPVPGTAANGQAVAATASGGATAGNFIAMGGGANAGTLTAVNVAGVNALGTPVEWQGTPESTALAVTNQINATVSTPEYVAAFAGPTVTIISDLGGTASNGRPVTFTMTGSFAVTPTTTTLSQGADPQDAQDASPASSVFTVTGSAPGAEASCTITVASTNNDETLTVLTVSGVSLINGTQNYPGAATSEAIAASLAAAIVDRSGVSGYTATVVDNIVTVHGVMRGAGPNGATPSVTTTGGLVMTPTAFSGGADGGRLLTLTIGGVSVIGGAVEGNASPAAMATAIAAAVTAHPSSPEYTASAVGGQVTVTAAVAGSAANDRVVALTKGSALTITPDPPPVMNNGRDSQIGTFQPGDFVRTVGSKMYSLSGSNVHFSGIKEPTKWTTATTGAGFIDMSSEASGSEKLTSLARYQNLVAVFAERLIQTWYFDPDPTLNKLSQVLNNTGTRSPRSVTQFGDNDIFYADASGIRSLRARDNTNSAATSDIGVAIDTLVVADFDELTAEQFRNVIGVIEPRDGRFWLAVRHKIYRLFSFFGEGENQRLDDLFSSEFDIDRYAGRSSARSICAPATRSTSMAASATLSPMTPPRLRRGSLTSTAASRRRRRRGRASTRRCAGSGKSTSACSRRMGTPATRSGRCSAPPTTTSASRSLASRRTSACA
jgi:hypothetical protein